MHANTLKRLVAAENYHSKIANQFFPAMFANIVPFLNSKIVLGGGGLAAKFKEFNPLPEQYTGADGSYIFYFENSSYTLSVVLRTSFPIEDRWQTVESRTYLGDLTQNILVKLHEHVKRAETWDFGVVQGRLFQIESFQEQIRQIKSSLPESVQSEISR